MASRKQQQSSGLCGKTRAEFVQNATTDQLRHVEGKLNRADNGTRRMTVEVQLESKSLTGPAWVTRKEDARPKAPEKSHFSPQGEPEPVTEAVVIEYPFEWKKFSSFKKSIRVVSYCIKWK